MNTLSHLSHLSHLSISRHVQIPSLSLHAPFPATFQIESDSDSELGHCTNPPVVSNVVDSSSSKTQLSNVRPIDSFVLKNPLGVSRRHNNRKRSILHRIFGSSLPDIVSSTRRVQQFIQSHLDSRQWKFSTADTYIHSISGTGAIMTTDPQWRDFVKYVSTRRLVEEVKFPRPLTPHHAMMLFENLKLEGEHELLAFASLAWAAASRISDLSKIRAKNVWRTGAATVLILFVEGKGVTMRGQAYAVLVTNPFVPSLVKILAKCKPDDQPFLDVDRTSLRKYIRKLHKDYELRSFRRGALQAMAVNGAPLDVLQSISGHASTETLLRYLNWGTTAMSRLQPQQLATEALWTVQQFD